ncbi:sulfotransferase domain-containing protein [Novosphingobium malaysiense]|uniref:Sulfotransferase domain-containing protein n=1 Tax=Novosphingobium malaysiense TaxID=1348853 RepID=A0A0B1ZLF6_9SPHN|nr:sulfotransferase domain-containing protein [Novosphingobium malaysiense]KHK90018.1 hypothetical protein LK12_19235 [Novosphingobium malaysiense]
MSFISKLQWDLERFGLTPRQVAHNIVHSRELPAPFMLNSIPKSGTHLLERIFSLHPDVRRKLVRKLFHKNLDRYGGFERQANSLRGGQYLLCHLPWDLGIGRALDGKGMKSVLIVRDPRAIFASEAHYIIRNEHHEHHHMVPSGKFEDALDFCLAYRQANEDPTYIDTALRFKGWLSHPGTIITKYETLVAGTRDARIAEIGRLFGHFGLRYDDRLLEAILDRSVFSTSLTFRKADPYSWKRELPQGWAEKITTLMPTFRDFGYEV